MIILRIRHFLRALHRPFAKASALFFLVTAIPLYAQNVPAAGSERETIDFEGIRIVFPKGEADVVEQLKPALRKLREERRRAVEAEADEIASGLSDNEIRDMLRKPVAAFTARESVSDQYNARWESQAAIIRTLAAAWRDWTGDISELQLWRQNELAPFQTRADGTDDAEGFSHRFPQVSFGKNGAKFAIQPPFHVPLFGLDMTLKLKGKTEALRLDLPLFYKPGESPEQIAAYGQKFLGQLPAFLHAEYSRASGLVAGLLHWTFEYMFLGEIEAVVVEKGTAEETALADGIARLMLFGQMLRQDGQEQTVKKFPNLFPFGIGGWDMSDPERILATLEKLDPLAKVERTNVTERIFARNLIAVTLLEIAQKDDTQAPILHKFKKAGVAVPVGGFTMDSFLASVDTAYGEKDFFKRTLATKKATSLEQLRQSAVRQKEQKEGGEIVAPKTPAASTAMPGRQSAKFDGLTITFPSELKGAVEIVGPEYAKMLAKARAEMEALCRKAPLASAEVADADAAAMRAYGIEPDAKLLREFSALVGGMQGGAQIARWFVSGDRMQIWIKEDMMDFLKGGGTIPDFTLASGGENVSFTFQASLPGKGLDAQKMAAGSSEALAEVVRWYDAMPRPVYPIVLKRGSLPAKLDDAAAVAAAIRAGEGQIFSTMRMADQAPEEASRSIASFTPPIGRELGWFVVAHEVAEAGIMKDVVRSADRRWFCDGLANWIAMQDVDRRLGPGKGAEAFAKNYNAAELRKHAAKVDILAWPAVEDIKNGLRPDVENSQAHYYFATLVIQKACEGRDAGFVKDWLNEIRKTPLNRANAGTVLAAYQKLTGHDLQDIIREVVK